MTPRQRLEAALRLESIDRVPAASPLQTGTIPLMKASGAFWPDAHRKPIEMAKLALAAHEYGGIESVRIPFCGTVEVEAVGCAIGGWASNKQLHTETYFLKNDSTIDKIEVPDPKKTGRMPVVTKAVQILSERVGKTLPVIAAIVSPFEFCVRSRSIGTVMRDMMIRPNLIKKILDFAVKVETEYARALVEAGAETIFFIDGSSNAEILGPQFYELYSKPYTKNVIENLRVPTILHICGDSLPILEKMVETGATAISIDYAVSISKAKNIIKSRASIVGNVNPAGALFKGVPQEVEDEAKSCINQGVDVLAPGCGFSPLTPIENMKTLVNVAQKYSKPKTL